MRNPLVKMDIDWTEEIAADFRRYQSDVETVIPGCWLYSRNISSVAVSVIKRALAIPYQQFIVDK